MAQVVANFVAQNAGQPSALGRLAGKAMPRFEGGQEGVLHEVFGHIGVAQLADGKVEQVIAVRLDPIIRRRSDWFCIHGQVGGDCQSEPT